MNQNADPQGAARENTANPDTLFPGKEWQTASPASQGVHADRLESAMAELDSFTNDDGITEAMIVRHGRLIWQGPNIDNFHPVWSCSKSFTSSVLGLVIDRGGCRLDEPIAKYVPSLHEHYSETTIKHFADFTVGYAFETVEDRERGWPLKPAPAVFAPGEKFYYSFSPDQISHMVSLITGEPMRELYRRHIADPIGMAPDEWSWGQWSEVDGVAVNNGAGNWGTGISITARQMARMGLLFLNGGQWEGRRILSDQWVEQSTSVSSPPSLPPYEPDSWYVRLPGCYGLNWWVNGISPDGMRQWPDAPPRTCAIQGNHNNICFVIPEWDMVAVRLGQDDVIDVGLYTQFFAKMREAILD